MSVADRRAKVERPSESTTGSEVSVRRQCALLDLARSGVYRVKAPTPADDLALMRRIDELHLALPFYDSRRMTFVLNAEGLAVNRKRMQRLMRVMGIEALVPRPGTSKAALGHKIYPYLLRGVAITEPNHAWAADITYGPMRYGFLYLVAVIDWASRAVLAWRSFRPVRTFSWPVGVVQTARGHRAVAAVAIAIALAFVGRFPFGPCVIEHDDPPGQDRQSKKTPSHPLVRCQFDGQRLVHTDPAGP